MTVPFSARLVPIFLSLRTNNERISIKLTKGYHYHKQISDYILDEIGTGTSKQDTKEYSYRRQSVLW